MEKEPGLGQVAAGSHLSKLPVLTIQQMSRYSKIDAWAAATRAPGPDHDLHTPVSAVPVEDMGTRARSSHMQAGGSWERQEENQCVESFAWVSLKILMTVAKQKGSPSVARKPPSPGLWTLRIALNRMVPEWSLRTVSCKAGT